jgi:glutamate synthase domain-containing protein 3
MTGGVAYVYDPMARLPGRYNAQLISLHRVTAPLYRQELYRLARAHFQATGSPRAKAILDDWEAELANFWLVLPKEAVAAIEAANEGAEKDEK